MILILLGTQDKQFVRILHEVDQLIINKVITEEVVAQVGNTKYVSKNMKLLDFIPYDEMQALIAKADLVITHGGVASIVDSIKLNKKIIAVPRLEKYGEHVNDHQIQIVEKMAANNYLIPLYDGDSLEKALEKSKRFTNKPFTSNNYHMLEIIEDFITNSNKNC
ncbi:MAG: glycosyltransferase [Bacilli bacterium]|nr:glycosyltransferase [Bacilli bacterium]